MIALRTSATGRPAADIAAELAIRTTRAASSGSLDSQALRRALMMASAVASFCVEGVGTRRLSTVTREQVSSRLDSLRSLVHLEGGNAL